jgi:hypothetical protein
MTVKTVSMNKTISIDYLLAFVISSKRKSASNGLISKRTRASKSVIGVVALLRILTGPDPCQTASRALRACVRFWPYSRQLKARGFCRGWLASWLLKSELRHNNNYDARIHGRCSDMGERSAFTIGACWTLALPFLARTSIASSNDLQVSIGEPSLEAKKDCPSQRIRPSGPRYTKRALVPIWLPHLMNLFSLSHGMDFRF